jgi:hypothetical protein
MRFRVTTEISSFFDHKAFSIKISYVIDSILDVKTINFHL